MPCEDSSTCSRNCDCDPVAEGPEPSSTDRKLLRCTCGHGRYLHANGRGLCIALPDCICQGFLCDHSRCGWKPPEEAHDFVSPAHCSACMLSWLPPGSVPEGEGEEPPLTPEEEEEAPEDVHDWHHASPEAGLTCTRCGLAHKNWDGSECPAMQADEPPPPQPLRRPPYAVAYSVQGHLYEVALPGDATVKAVDGALVIQHHLGPVAAICQVLPIVNEESD